MELKIESMCPLIQVYDINTSLSFYCDILGFKIHASAGENHDLGWVWLKRDQLDLMLNSAYETPVRPDMPDLKRIRIHGDTAFYFGCPDLEGAYQYFLSKELEVRPPSETSYGMKQLYLIDPDGYNLCFQWTV